MRRVSRCCRAVAALAVTGLMLAPPPALLHAAAVQPVTEASDGAIAALTTAEMARVAGGQPTATEIFCSSEDLMSGWFWYALTGRFEGMLLKCAASIEIDLLDQALTDPLEQSIRYWLETLEDDWVARGIRYIDFVFVQGYVEYIDLPVPALVDLNMQALIDSLYCGDIGCWCDTGIDCFWMYCSASGYCE